MTKAAVGKVYVEISVVIGWSTMPIHQLLRMGRGAVIELNTTVNDPAYLYVNDHLVARGEVMARYNSLAAACGRLMEDGSRSRRA